MSLLPVLYNLVVCSATRKRDHAFNIRSNQCQFIVGQNNLLMEPDTSSRLMFGQKLPNYFSKRILEFILIKNLCIIQLHFCLNVKLFYISYLISIFEGIDVVKFYTIVSTLTDFCKFYWPFM